MKVTVICVYSPHNSSLKENIEDFYTTLRSTIEQVPLHNFLVIAGDLNAKLGPSDVKFTYNNQTNRNGEYLVDFMDEFNLFSANNSFMKPKVNYGHSNTPMAIGHSLTISFLERNGEIVLKTLDHTQHLALWALTIEWSLLTSNLALESPRKLLPTP